MKPTIAQRLVLYLATLATLAGAMTVTCAATAAAARARINAKPERVVVNQAYENVPWSVRSRNGCLEDAHVTLEHVRSRTMVYSGSDSWPRNGLSGDLKLYDFVHMGKYRVYGEGWNHCRGRLGAYSTFSPDFITVKRAARVALNGHRHRRRLTLTANVVKYHGGHRVWVNHSDVTVVFQRKTRHGWKRVRSDPTNRRGVARVQIHRGVRARYRARVRPTATVWGDVSAGIRR